MAHGGWRIVADWWILDSSQVRSLLSVTSLIHPSFFKGARGHCVTGGGCYAAANKDGFCQPPCPDTYTDVYAHAHVCIYKHSTKDSMPGREKWRIRILDIKDSASDHDSFSSNESAPWLFPLVVSEYWSCTWKLVDICLFPKTSPTIRKWDRTIG